MFIFHIDTNKYMYYNQIMVKGIGGIIMAKEKIIDLVGILLFYTLIVVGVIIVNNRLSIETESYNISIPN